MANQFRVRKGLIVNGSGSTLLDVQGSQGQLFSITDSLSGSLFAVKDISGIPVIEAFSDNRVNIGTFNAEAIKVSGSFAFLTGSLLGTASWAENARTASLATTASFAVTASYFSGSISNAILAATASFVTASNVFGPFGSNSVLSSSYALTASFALNGGGAATPAFPYTGSAQITGSLVVTGSVSSTQGFTGSLFGTASWAQNAVTASFAQTASYGINIVISGSITNADYIQFNTASSVTDAVGRLYYDSGEGTIKIGMAGGNVVANIGEDLYQYAYNATGAPLTKGQVVYISGSQGNRIAVKLASATAEQGSANTLGLVAESIGTGGEGWIQTEGVMRKLNTTGLVGGQLLYLSSSAGEYTQTKPLAPLHEVRLGYAERIDATVGSIYIKIDNGYEIDELHNVLDTTTTSSYGDLFVKSGSLWVSSKQLTGSYGLTGSLTATTINASFLTASGNNYPTNPGTSSYFLQTDGAGNLSWNYVRSVLESVKNVGATTLVKGTPVYVTSSVGNTAEVVKADAGSASLMPATYILNETLTAGQQGLGIVLGFINNIDTSTFEESDQVYVAVGGGYTNVQPTGSALIQPLGTVVRVDNTNGSIMVSNTGVSNNIPNLNPGYVWMGNGDWLATPTPTSSLLVNTASFAYTASSADAFRVRNNLYLSTPTYNTSSVNVLTINTGSNEVEYSTITDLTYIKNVVTVGLPGSLNVDFNSIKSAVDSITGATSTNPYAVRVRAGLYNEDPIQMKSFVAVVGDSSETTVVQANDPSQSLFLGADQSLISDMKIQGVTAPSQSAILYYTSQSVASQGIVYVENVRFGANYTHAKMFPVSGGNAAMQLTNIKYGAQPFTLGFYITSDGISTGRMLLRNTTTTAGGIQSTTGLVFAKTDQPNCTLLANLVGLTKVGSGAAQGIGYWVENGGLLRINTSNLQRFSTGIYVPQVGSAPTIDAVGLNFENCTTDVNIIHTGSIGKVAGTDNFLKTQISYEAPLYEVGQDQRKITVNRKGGDFTSISASVAYITDSSETNRYVIEVGPGEFTEKQIDLRNKPYVSIIGSTIQTTQIRASGSGDFDQILLGPTNEISFLSIYGVNTAGYAAIKVDGTGDNFAQAHKISIYDFDYGIKVFSSVSSSTFYGEYVDINGAFTYGTYVSASNTSASIASMENYYLFPAGGVSTGNYAIGPGSEVDLYTCLFVGDSVAGSTAVYLADGAVAEVAGMDAQNWDYGVRVPNIGSAPTFRMVGAMIHTSITYDFFVEKVGTQGRFQGIADHTKINNVSEDFYWNFLDDTDGENDITRKLSVTFEDGTHTDATTLIFKGSPMGVMEGGTISIQSGLTITTAAGFGYLQDAIDVNVYKRIDWNNTNITLAANTNNYIYINDNAVLSASGTAPDSVTNIILGRVVTNDTGIELIDQIPYDGEHTSNALSKFAREALGPVFAEGCIVSENVTPFKLDVTQGSYYFAENNFLPSGTSSINLNQYYISASAWARFTSSVVPNNVYASGSQLIAMSASYYTKHTTYLVGDGVDEEYFLVINDNQYATLVEAEGANLPTIPTYFSDGVVPLAAVYVQSGSANITQIEDIRPVIGFRAAGVNATAVHGNLLGLSADDHTQYLLVDGGRQMSGDLGLGGNDLYNFASVSGSSITASGANISSIIADSVNATSFTGSLLGTAATASYVLQAVSSSFSSNAATASYVQLAQTASFVTLAQTASFVATASWARNSITASYVQQAQSASYVLQAVSASFATNSATASFVATASWAENAVTASFVTLAQTASFVTLAQTASFVSLAQTASFVTTAQTASFVTLAQSASYVLQAVSSSFASTASFVTLAQTASFVATASWANNAVSSSFATTASYYELVTGSAGTNFNIVPTPSGSIINIPNASTTARGLITTESQAIAGQKTFTGLSTAFNGSIFVGGTIVANSTFAVTSGTGVASTAASQLQLLGSSNMGYRVAFPFAAGQALDGNPYASVIIGSNNTTEGGSGTHTLVSQLVVKQLNLINSTGATTNGATVYIEGAISGSANPTNNYALWVDSGSIRLDGDLIMSQSNVIVTGSVMSTEGFTGSLLGTSSWAQNAVTASYVTGSVFTSDNPALSASYALTASFALNAGGASAITVADEGTSQGTATFLNFTGAGVTATVSSNTASINIPGGTGDTFPYTGSAIISGSLIVTGSVSSTGGFTGSLLGTASWAEQAVTASFVTLAQTASFVTLAQSASFVTLAQSASYVLQAVSASFATNAATASFVTLAQTASFVTLAQSASYVLQAVSASYATAASYSLATKAGAVANTSFAGNPRKATATFGSAFPNTSYAVTITGEDARTWTIESKLAGSFVINANANTALNGTTYWIATQYNS